MAILRPQSSLPGFVNHCRETAQYREREREIRTGEWILGLFPPKCLYKLVYTLMPSSENDRRTERPVVSEMVTVEASCFSHRMFSTFR